MPSAPGLASAVLWIAGLAIWTAALMPQFFPIWRGSRDALDVIAEHAALWRVNAILFLVGAVATMVGCALVLSARAGPFARSALVLLAVATPLWLVVQAARMSVMPALALDRSPEAEAGFALTRRLASAVWLVAAALIIVAFAGFGAEVLATGLLQPWIGWVCAGSAALSTAILVATRDAPPVAVYLPVLPLAVAVSVEAARGPG